MIYKGLFHFMKRKQIYMDLKDKTINVKDILNL